MKNTLLIFSAILFVFSCNTIKKTNETTGIKTYFTIQIEQEGEIISPVNDIITLKKKPFKFKIQMKGIEGLFVSTTWDDAMYNFPSNKNIFFCDDENSYEDCGFLSPNTMASENFNKDKELNVTSNQRQHYWFYSEGDKWHRLDKGVTVKNGTVNASFTVEKIFDVLLKDSKDPDMKKEYPISEINKDIYVVFAAEKTSKDPKSHKEAQREKFILRFE